MCGQLSVSSSGSPLYISLLQGSNWLGLRKFTLKKDYSHIQVTIDIIRWNPLTWPINNTYSDSISALLTMSKPLTMWITINWKILKEMGIPDH